MPYICKISCNYFNYMNILNDTRRSKDIQKKRKLVEKLGFSINQINKIPSKRNV